MLILYLHSSKIIHPVDQNSLIDILIYWLNRLCVHFSVAQFKSGQAIRKAISDRKKERKKKQTNWTHWWCLFLEDAIFSLQMSSKNHLQVHSMMMKRIWQKMQIWLRLVVKWSDHFLSGCSINKVCWLFSRLTLKPIKDKMWFVQQDLSRLTTRTLKSAAAAAAAALVKNTEKNKISA